VFPERHQHHMSHEKCHFFETATLAHLERFLTRFCTTETGINTSYTEDTEFKLQHNCVSAFFTNKQNAGCSHFLDTRHIAITGFCC